MRTSIKPCFFTVAIFAACAASACAESDRGNKQIFVFNSDGGAAAIAHSKGEVTNEVVCHELDELEGTAVTDFFWCPIVGGNVFIYPTEVGERIGDNIRDWAKVHPYYREQGRAMADNLRQLVERHEDPVKILSARAKALGIRFWLTCRMNEIHEDDDRFMAVRSLFKEQHPELLHGKTHHPEAIYAPKKGYSYAWDYGQAPVREHFLTLFREWLRYEIDGIELDFCRSPCLFPPGQEKVGMPLLTEFVTKLRAMARATADSRGSKVKLAIRVPPSLRRCREAGIDVTTWIDQGLVDIVTPMDRGYFDPEPRLMEFVRLAKPHGVIVLGGIEPKVRGYRQSNRQTFAAVATFLHSGANGVYLFNYDCHRLQAAAWEFGGVLKPYTPDEVSFLKHALDPDVWRYHDKQYLVSQASNRKLAEDGGGRPLRCRLPVGESRTFSITIGDDLHAAVDEKRIRSSRLVVTLADCSPNPDEVDLRINGQTQGPDRYRLESRKPSGQITITVVDPPIRQGTNIFKLGLKPGSRQGGLINSIDVNIDYRSP